MKAIAASLTAVVVSAGMAHAQFINGGLCEPYERHIDCHFSGGVHESYTIAPHVMWLQQPATFLWLDPDCKFHVMLGSTCMMTCQLSRSSGRQAAFGACKLSP